MNFDTQNPSRIVHRRKDFGGQNPRILTPRILGTDLKIISSFKIMKIGVSVWQITMKNMYLPLMNMNMRKLMKMMKIMLRMRKMTNKVVRILHSADII